MDKDTTLFVLQALAVAALAVASGIAIVVGINYIMDSKQENGDKRCQQIYGSQWHWTNRTAADCINKNGDGKFLP